jgi:hypothetical protein
VRSRYDGGTSDNASVRLRSCLLVSVVAVACCWSLPAEAARAPTYLEREGITQALPASIRSIPAGCVWLETSVSKNGRWALVAPRFLNALHAPCLRYAGNGAFLLEKLETWKVVFAGSDPAPCSLHAPRDLVPGCRR